MLIRDCSRITGQDSCNLLWPKALHEYLLSLFAVSDYNWPDLRVLRGIIVFCVKAAISSLNGFPAGLLQSHLLRSYRAERKDR